MFHKCAPQRISLLLDIYYCYVFFRIFFLTSNHRFIVLISDLASSLVKSRVIKAILSVFLLYDIPRRFAQYICDQYKDGYKIPMHTPVYYQTRTLSYVVMTAPGKMLHAGWCKLCTHTHTYTKYMADRWLCKCRTQSIHCSGHHDIGTTSERGEVRFPFNWICRNTRTQPYKCLCCRKRRFKKQEK